MRHDFIIGLTVSAGIHAGVLFGHHLFPARPLIKHVPAPEPAVLVMDVPKFEPDEPEKIERTNEEVKPVEFAPPMQPDAPQVTTDTSFVQRVQPPPPENVAVSATMMAVPQDRTPSQLHNIPVFDPSSLDQQPVARVKTPPQYPFEMQRNGVSGEVLVDFIVDANGEVQNAYALRSSQREFEAAAVQAVGKWKFKAGRKNGRFVNTHMQVPIVFTLDNA